MPFINNCKLYFLSEVGLSQDQNDYIVNFDFFNCLGLRRESVNSNKSCRESVISMQKISQKLLPIFGCIQLN